MRAVRPIRAAAAMSLLSVLGLGACATRPPASDTEATQEFNQTNDPLEPTNRFFYDVNDKIDRYSLKPVAQAYVYVTPEPVRNGIHNALANLGSPVLFVDDVSQANPRRAGDTFMRFLINSSIGVLGIFDVAKGFGYAAHDNSFGITLALWGVPEGPYLYLPVLGPNTARSATGFAVDQAADPFNYVPTGLGLHTFNWATTIIGAVDTRSRYLNDVDRVKASALDPYATFRSLYRQHSQAEIDAARADQRATTPDWYSQ
jgi:phospholipid-binding lipoprotein MlaA